MTFTGRKNAGRGHTYFIDGVKVPGVTTILSNGLPKPALVSWAANCAADLAVDEWDTLAQLPPSERRKRIAKAPDAARTSAGVKGTRVHALADKLSKGQQVPVPPDLTGHVDSCVAFLDDYDPETILAEAPVISRKWQYGGTLDLIARIDGKNWLLDWKTSRSGPYGDTAFQLAAYRFAEATIDAEGRERPLPPIDECGVVWLRPDGYDLHPYYADEGVWREFLYIAQTAKAAENCRDYKGDALVPPARTSA